MTVGWALLGVAVLCWPLPRRAELRLIALATAGRLVPAAPRQTSRPFRWQPTRGWVLAVAGAVGVALGVAVGPPLGVAGATVASVAGLSALRYLGRRGELAAEREFLEALRMLCTELDAGADPAAALRAAARTSIRYRPVFASATEAAQGGSEVSPVLVAGGKELGPLAAGWQLAESAGTPLADVLGRLADDRAARLAQRRSVQQQLAGPRSSALLLACLPVLGLVLGATMGARPLPILLHTRAGQLLLCAGVLLDTAGVLWTAQLMSRAEDR